jgi:photosystem II stability/assembly factor-like uncharacterized protein
MRNGGSFLNLSGCVIFLSGLLSGAASGAGQSAWSPVGPPGGPLDAIVVDPVNPRNLFAGTEQGGVYRSSDGGTTWTLASSGLTDPTVNALALDPAHPSTLYAGTNGGLPVSRAGLFKTTDGGAHWAPSNTGLPSGRAVRGIAIDPSNSARLLVALAGNGIYESDDQGATWTSRSSGLTVLVMNSVAIDPRDPSIAWAGAYGLVFKTVDGGATWTEADAGLPSTSMDALLPDPAQSGRVFAGTGQGIFVTTDGGAHWAASSAGMPTLPEIFAVVRAADGALYATDYNSGVYRSTDSGAHWVPVNMGLPAPYGYWALAVDPGQPSLVYLTTDAFGGTVFRTTDAGAHWSVSGGGISALWVNAVAVDPRRDTTFFAGTFGSGVYRTLDGGLTWEPSDRQDLPVEALLVDPFDTSIVFAAVQRDAGIFRSQDEGATWKASGQGTSGNFYAIVASVSGTTLYAGGGQGRLRERRFRRPLEPVEQWPDGGSHPHHRPRPGERFDPVCRKPRGSVQEHERRPFLVVIVGRLSGQRRGGGRCDRSFRSRPPLRGTGRRRGLRERRWRPALVAEERRSLLHGRRERNRDQPVRPGGDLGLDLWRRHIPER